MNNTTEDFSRRKFIQTLLGGIALGPAMFSMQRPSTAGIPTRPLGNTGERVSIIGYGGWDSVVGKSDKESIDLMHEALDNGITFYDNAWEYNRGRSEEVMGKAFADSSRRSRIFLMTKVCARDYQNAKKQIHESLQRLQTDYVDLMQFHSVQYDGDIQRIFDPENGALKAVLEAKEEGKIKYIGFSGHMFTDVHLEMLDKDINWDTVQLPLNIVDAHYNSFQKKVLPVLNKRNIGALGMKSLCAQDARLPKETNVSVQLCRKYALSLPISTLVCGMQTRSELLSDIEVARNFKPLTEKEIADLLDKSSTAGKTGKIERYKDPQGGYGCSYHSHVLREG